MPRPTWDDLRTHVERERARQKVREKIIVWRGRELVSVCGKYRMVRHVNRWGLVRYTVERLVEDRWVSVTLGEHSWGSAKREAEEREQRRLKGEGR